MLTINLPKTEYFDEENQEFITVEETTLELEHSLVSLSKWESKWEKPFLSTKELTDEETMDYVRCMTITPNVPPEVYSLLTASHLDKVNDHVRAKMTATWFAESQQKGQGNKEIITAELVYFWMITLSIPFECQHWHLSRLLTLIRVCNEKNQPAKKMGKSDIAARNRSLNAQRKAQMQTKG